MFYAPVSEAVKGEQGKWAPICAQVIGEKECIAARRPHILRLIEQHPENKLAGDWGARIYPTSLDPLPDPAGYAEAKKLWLEQISRPDVTVAVLKNAAYFFEAADKPLAEKMMLRAQALDPKGHWSGSLGRLYAFVLLWFQLLHAAKRGPHGKHGRCPRPLRPGDPQEAGSDDGSGTAGRGRGLPNFFTGTKSMTSILARWARHISNGPCS